MAAITIWTLGRFTLLWTLQRYTFNWKLCTHKKYVWWKWLWFLRLVWKYRSRQILMWHSLEYIISFKVDLKMRENVTYRWIHVNRTQKFRNSTLFFKYEIMKCKYFNLLCQACQWHRQNCYFKSIKCTQKSLKVKMVDSYNSGWKL